MAANGEEPMAETVNDQDFLGLFREKVREIIESLILRIPEIRYRAKRKGGFYAKRLNRMRIVRGHKRKKAR